MVSEVNCTVWKGAVTKQFGELTRLRENLSQGAFAGNVPLRNLLSWAFADAIECFENPRALIEARLEEFLEVFMRKFELRKYLLSAYQWPDFKPASHIRANVDEYVLFEALLMVAYRATHDVRYLNTALKVAELPGMPADNEIHQLCLHESKAAVASL